MKYDWEAKAEKELKDKVKAINDCLDSKSKFQIIGIAIENITTGEAMFLPMIEQDGSVLFSDLLLDVVGDADDLYVESLEARRLNIQARRLQ